MDKLIRAQKRNESVLKQLEAEIGASDYTVKSLAAAIGKDYITFRRYVRGERPMPMNVLWDALEALDVPEEVFFRRARERFEG